MPLEVSAHEGAHFVMAKAVGAKGFKLRLLDPIKERGVVSTEWSYEGLSKGQRVAIFLAPKLLELVVVTGGLILLEHVTGPILTGFIRSLICVAALDFFISTKDWRGAYWAAY